MCRRINRKDRLMFVRSRAENRRTQFHSSTVSFNFVLIISAFTIQSPRMVYSLVREGKKWSHQSLFLFFYKLPMFSKCLFLLLVLREHGIKLVQSRQKILMLGSTISLLVDSRRHIPQRLFSLLFFAGEFEELKDTVICLCKGDYLTALQGKTSQHLLHLAAASSGEISVTYHHNNFVGSLRLVVPLTGELIMCRITITIIIMILSLWS